MIVSGTAVIGAENPKEVIVTLRETVDQAITSKS
jgi:hypothetical protein